MENQKNAQTLINSGEGWVATGFENGFSNTVWKGMETKESGHNKYQHNDIT